jgi:subtilisin family serine protease
MKKITKLLLASLFISSLIFADDFYWSLGQKVKIIKQDNLAVVPVNNFSAAALKNNNFKLETWPKQFRRATGKYQLINTKESAPGSLQTKNVLPVYKDQTGELILPTENIIIGIKKDSSKSGIKILAEKYGLELKHFNSPMPGMAVLSVPPEKFSEIIDLSNELRNDSEIRWAQSDFIAPHYKRTVVNDPLFNIQWHLTNDGHLANATVGADAKVATAWATTMGTSVVRVCIFDDAVEKDHEDLSPNFVAGLDLDTMGPDPSPQVLAGENAEIHGTACSGVAVSRGNNGLGGSGAAPYCSLMGIRWGTTDGTDVKGFFWARTNGADIISCSWGTRMGNALYEAIRDAAVNGRNGLGCPIFFAAGNSGKKISKYDPARHPYVICVTASNAQDKRSSYSSYGDVASVTAPSDDSGMPGITTTDYMESKGYSSDNYCRATDSTGFGGTSSATPLAAGIGALCLSANTNLTYLNVKALLQETADKIDSSTHTYNSYGWNEYLGYGRINAGKAVQLAQNYTNTPFAFISAKGKINVKSKKMTAKLQYLSGMLYNYKGDVTVELDGNVVATFDASSWKWNTKNPKGKNKNANKDLLKITAKLTKQKIILKIKNLAYVPTGNSTELTLAFSGGQIGKITLNLSSKGKFKQ